MPQCELFAHFLPHPTNTISNYCVNLIIILNTIVYNPKCGDQHFDTLNEKSLNAHAFTASKSRSPHLGLYSVKMVKVLNIDFDGRRK